MIAARGYEGIHTTSDMQPLIRRSTPADRDAILAFVERMGFNPRDAITWDGLHMRAMTAWLGHRLVGAIPVEPRPLKISPTRTVDTLHETVVAVYPEFRSDGLGTRLQDALFAAAAGEADLITVFREDPDSPAYRWYVKNGFRRATHVQIWAIDDASAVAVGTPQVWSVDDPQLPWVTIEARWAQQTGAGGVVDRAARPLRPWLAIHPYRSRYQFRIVSDSRGGFVLLGAGTMHSDRPRCDVLELMPADHDLESSASLIRAAASVAARDGQALRFPVSVGDQLNLSLMPDLGARADWSFDMLARPVSETLFGEADTAHWRYAGIDFI